MTDQEFKQYYSDFKEKAAKLEKERNAVYSLERKVHDEYETLRYEYLKQRGVPFDKIFITKEGFTCKIAQARADVDNTDTIKVSLSLRGTGYYRSVSFDEFLEAQSNGSIKEFSKEHWKFPSRVVLAEIRKVKDNMFVGPDKKR